MTNGNRQRNEDFFMLHRLLWSDASELQTWLETTENRTPVNAGESSFCMDRQQF
jgi:hypothetical protein